MTNSTKAALIASIFPIIALMIILLAPPKEPEPERVQTEAEIISGAAWYAKKVVVPHFLGDPGSYEWISTEQVKPYKEGHLTFKVTFRARNSYNALVINSAIVDTWSVEEGITGRVLYFAR